jgi:hypothetical protein
MHVKLNKHPHQTEKDRIGHHPKPLSLLPLQSYSSAAAAAATLSLILLGLSANTIFGGV